LNICDKSQADLKDIRQIAKELLPNDKPPKRSSFSYWQINSGYLALLHISVALRVIADLFEWIELRAASGLLTVVALMSYVGTVLVATQFGGPKNRSAIRA
jgi:hypothetical protein